MRWDDLYVAATGAALPPTVTVEDAIAAGRYDQEGAQFTDMLAVTVAGPHDSIGDLLAGAARQARDRAGVPAERVGAVLTSVAYHSGIDVWNGAAYVQGQVAAAGSYAAEVRAGSNGGLMALELAAGWLCAHPDAELVLVTAGDQWYEPYVDRWRTDKILFGDGAGAVGLSRRGGFARAVSLVSTTDPGLEGLHRGDQPWGPVAAQAEQPVSLVRRHDAYMAARDREEIWARLQAGAVEVAARALEESDRKIGDVDHVVVPHFGRFLLTRQCLEPLGGAGLERTTWEFSRQVGHLGPGDQFAGLDHLAVAGRLRPGDTVLLYGVGAGFSWSCAVLDVLSAPPLER